jgi:DNA-binding transcriptional ArsR family regulator
MINSWVNCLIGLLIMQDNLSRTFAALADPTRQAMLAQRSVGEANVSDLAQPFFEKNEPACSH